MEDVDALLRQWQLDIGAVRERVYRAPTARERERWHALWLLARGWSSAEVAAALERDAHTVGDWLAGFRRVGPAGLAFEQSGGSPPLSTRSSRRS
jgi:transposase